MQTPGSQLCPSAVMPLYEQIKERGHYLWGDAHYSVLTNVVPGRNDRQLHKFHRYLYLGVHFDHTFAEARLVRYELRIGGVLEKGTILRTCRGQDVNDAVEKLSTLLGILMSCSTCTISGELITKDLCETNSKAARRAGVVRMVLRGGTDGDRG